jgi:ribosomal-protein-alanine N-acetyltransferase
MRFMDAGRNDLKIRAMAESDLDRVMEIAASLPMAPQWGRSAYEIAISIGDGPGRIALVAEQAGGVIGFVIASVITRQAEIETVAVEDGVQGCGFGSSLLRAMLEELRRIEVGVVELEVRSSNERALRLYRRAGFREVGRRRGYYRAPVEDAVLLRLGL